MSHIRNMHFFIFTTNSFFSMTYTLVCVPQFSYIRNKQVSGKYFIVVVFGKLGYVILNRACLLLFSKQKNTPEYPSAV
jgi:hypothetical protein